MLVHYLGMPMKMLLKLLPYSIGPPFHCSNFPMNCVCFFGGSTTKRMALRCKRWYIWYLQLSFALHSTLGLGGGGGGCTSSFPIRSPHVFFITHHSFFNASPIIFPHCSMRNQFLLLRLFFKPVHITGLNWSINTQPSLKSSWLKYQFHLLLVHLWFLFVLFVLVNFKFIC